MLHLPEIVCSNFLQVCFYHNFSVPQTWAGGLISFTNSCLWCIVHAVKIKISMGRHDGVYIYQTSHVVMIKNDKQERYIESMVV